MDCQEVREKLLKMIDGDLRITERLCAEVHLSQCYTCREELAELSEEVNLIHQVLRHPAPENRFDELKRHLTPPPMPKRVEQPQPKLRFRERARGLAAAATVAFAINMVSPLFSAAFDISNQFPSVASAQTSRTAPIAFVLFVDRYQNIVDRVELTSPQRPSNTDPPTVPED